MVGEEIDEGSGRIDDLAGPYGIQDPLYGS